MKAVDVLFGKFISGSDYHVKLLYVTREDCHADEDMLIVGAEAIANIVNTIDVPDTAMVLLGRIKTDLETIQQTLPNDIDEIVKDLNKATAELEFNGYEFLLIGRNDVDSSIPYDGESDHAYMMIKNIIGKMLYGVNNLQLGICATFEDPYASNMNAMVMEFIANGKFRLGDEEDEAMCNLGGYLQEYNALSQRHETAYMDTRKLLHMLESIGYRYRIFIV